VPVLLKGNTDLNVEHVLAWEAGYKGELGSRAYLTVDAYWNHLQDFVVLEPGGNPAYGPWTAPSAVPDPAKAPLEQAVHDQLAAAGQDVAAAGLTNLPDGSTAIVVSYTNAGKVQEAGVEIGAGYQLTSAVRADASLGYFDFKVVEAAPTAPLNPNTPGWKGTVSLSYADRRGWDWGISARLTDGFMWTSGVDRGYVPAAETVNASVGYRITPRWRIYAMGTNLLNQHRFQMYDGSVIGRRVLAGLTAYF